MRWIMLILAMLAAWPTQASSCIKTGSQCIDNTPCKNIAGYTVCLSSIGQTCWRYEDTYTCLKPDSVDYCKPLSDAGCWQTGTMCIQYDTVVGTGACMRQTQTWRCNDPAMPTPPNTIRLSDTYTLVSSDYDTTPCAPHDSKPGCSLAESKCISTTPHSPLPPGIDPATVAPDGCYQRENIYACLSGNADTSECDYYAAQGCTYVETLPCDPEVLVNGVCTVEQKRYKCLSTPAGSKTITDCSEKTFCVEGQCFDTSYTNDEDFAKTVAMMEAMRQAGMYMDEGNLTVFNGKFNSCTIKIGSLVNCCKAKSAGAAPNSTAIKAIGEGIGFGYDYARSTYMYDVLFKNDAPDWVLKSLYGSGSGMSLSPSFSYYGFSVGLGTHIAPGSITLFNNGTFSIGFDPMSFAISIAINFIMSELLSCDQEDMMTAMRRNSNLCIEVGQYCSSKFLKVCVERKRTHCCYNSRLSKIINQQGRAQLGKGFGSVASPDCRGFTIGELQSLDFSAMDLSEFYAEIQAKMIDTAAIKDSIKNRIIADPTKSYFREKTSP